MKTKLFFVAVLCPLLFGVSLAQQALSQDYLQDRKSPAGQEMEKNRTKSSIRSQWNGLAGNGVIVGLLKDPDFRAELGVSDEQYERMRVAVKDIRDPEKNSELKKIFEEQKSIIDANGRVLQNADEATKKRFFDLEEKAATMTVVLNADDNELHSHNVAKIMEMTLTPEQKQKIKEVQLVAALSDVSIFPPSMFETLDLTDVQKQEMEKIKKQLETELEKPLEDLANRNLAIMNWMYDESEKKGIRGISTGIIDESGNKQVKDESEKIGEETESYGKQYAMQFKTQMLDVLTDEQWMRLQNMIDNPSGLVKIMFDKVKAWHEKKGVWAPGPNSWKPGDPIPEGYRQQRQERGRFPRNVPSE